MRAAQGGTGSLPASASRSRPAFTLVEMTIVIGIIVLLAGLTLAVSVSVVQGSEIRQTKLTIQLLDTALQDWELQADRKISYGVSDPSSGVFYEIQQDDDNPEQVTGELLTIISRSRLIKEILAQVDAEFLGQIDDIINPDIKHLQLRDAWGQPILAIFPGPNWAVGAPGPDADGTVRTQTEDWSGVAENRRICFVSPGPDGRLGELNAAEQTPEFLEAQDNLYSYIPLPPVEP